MRAHREAAPSLFTLFTTQGEWMPTENTARMSAALVLCGVLHSCGELGPNLNPVGKEDMAIELCGPLQEEPTGRPGSTRRRQYYEKKVRKLYCRFAYMTDISIFSRMVFALFTHIIY